MWLHPELAEVGDPPQAGYNEAMHKHLRRLDRIWPDSPIYFITMCTKNRRAVLARDETSEILIVEWRAAHERHGLAVGRYVIMPDHVHFFCGPELGARKLSEFIGAWKSWTSRRMNALLQLQGCGNASSLFFAPMKVTARNGITLSMTRCVRGWFLQRRNGNTPERLKR